MTQPKDGDHEGAGWVATLRNNFVTGIVVVGPLAITVYLARAFLEWVDSTVKPLIPSAWNPDSYLPFAVPGFGLVVALLLITSLGALTASLLGRTIFSYGEQLLDRTPFVRPVYRTLKQVFETVVSKRENSFAEAGLIEWPRPGLWSVVFLSAPARGEIADKLGEADDWVTVFIPTTPNPTGGYIMFVRRRDIVPLDMPVEDAAKLVISAGLVVPPAKPKPPPVDMPLEPAYHVDHGRDPRPPLDHPAGLSGTGAPQLEPGPRTADRAGRGLRPL